MTPASASWHQLEAHCSSLAGLRWLFELWLHLADLDPCGFNILSDYVLFCHLNMKRGAIGWLKKKGVENFTSYLTPFQSCLESDDKALGSNIILFFPPHCHRHLYFVSMGKKNFWEAFLCGLLLRVNESHSGFVHVLKVYVHTFPLFEKIKLSAKLIASLTFSYWRKCFSERLSQVKISIAFGLWSCKYDSTKQLIIATSLLALLVSKLIFIQMNSEIQRGSNSRACDCRYIAGLGTFENCFINPQVNLQRQPHKPTLLRQKGSIDAARPNKVVTPLVKPSLTWAISRVMQIRARQSNHFSLLFTILMEE